MSLVREPAGGNRGAGGDPRLGEVEHLLPDVGGGQGLADAGLMVSSQVLGELYELDNRAGAGSAADGRPLAGEHRPEDLARLADLADQALVGHVDASRNTSLKW